MLRSEQKSDKVPSTDDCSLVQEMMTQSHKALTAIFEIVYIKNVTVTVIIIF